MPQNRWQSDALSEPLESTMGGNIELGEGNGNMKVLS